MLCLERKSNENADFCSSLGPQPHQIGLIVAMGTQEQAKTLEVVFKLLRALAHRVRGDLSVLNNDLAYLATVVGDSEVERSRGRLTQIAGIMGEICALNQGAGYQNISALDALSPILYGCQNLVGGEILKGLCITAQREQLVSLGRIFNELFGPLERAELSLKDPNMLNVMLTPSLSISDKPARGERCSSITEFVEGALGERLIFKGGIADLILLGHGWQALVGDNRITVCVPVTSFLG